MRRLDDQYSRESQIPLLGNSDPGNHRFVDCAPLGAAAYPVCSHFAAVEATSKLSQASQKRDTPACLRAQTRRFTSVEVGCAVTLDRYRVTRPLPDPMAMTWRVR